VRVDRYEGTVVRSTDGTREPPGRHSWLPVWSPVAVQRANRATLVMPTLFGHYLQGVRSGNLQIALFTGFGSFATLVMVTFAGTWRDKRTAHAGLAHAGSALLVICTAVSSSTTLPVLVT